MTDSDSGVKMSTLAVASARSQWTCDPIGGFAYTEKDTSKPKQVSNSHTGEAKSSSRRTDKANK